MNLITINNYFDFLGKKNQLLLEENIINVGSRINEEIIKNLPLLPKYYYGKYSEGRCIFNLSFGDIKYKKAQFRIFSQAINIPLFTNVIAFNENSLQLHKEFWNKHGEFITNSSRGYGYWIWKSFIIYEMLKYIKDDDIIVYTDTGCVLNKKAIYRLEEYINIVNSNNTGILAFQVGSLFTESQYTKMDVIEYLNAHDLLDTCQVAATVIIIRKCKRSIEFITKWYELCCKHELIDDSKSNISNRFNFVDHRHDQSFFSILCKLYGVSILPDETEHINDKFPIWGIRQRDD